MTEPVINVDANDIIQSLIQQVAEKAGQVAVLEAKVLAMARLLEPTGPLWQPEVSDVNGDDDPTPSD